MISNGVWVWFWWNVECVESMMLKRFWLTRIHPWWCCLLLGGGGVVIEFDGDRNEFEWLGGVETPYWLVAYQAWIWYSDTAHSINISSLLLYHRAYPPPVVTVAGFLISLQDLNSWEVCVDVGHNHRVGSGSTKNSEGVLQVIPTKVSNFNCSSIRFSIDFVNNIIYIISKS